MNNLHFYSFSLLDLYADTGWPTMWVAFTVSFLSFPKSLLLARLLLTVGKLQRASWNPGHSLSLYQPP